MTKEHHKHRTERDLREIRGNPKWNISNIGGSGGGEVGGGGCSCGGVSAATAAAVCRAGMNDLV